MTAAVKSCGCCYHHAHCPIDANSGGTTEKTRDLIQPTLWAPSTYAGFASDLKVRSTQIKLESPYVPSCGKADVHRQIGEPDVKDTPALDGGTVADRGSRGVEVHVLCR
jgi:hypothetical protein